LLILALESSAKSASCAVCDDYALLGQYYQNSKLTHSRTLLSMAEALLHNLDVTLNEIELIAVSQGPGSFTGTRIGVAAAKGLAWGLDIPACGVSSLQAMAFQAPETQSILCPVMDARRGQVYNALFVWKDGILVRQCEDRAISLDALASELLSGSVTVNAPDNFQGIVQGNAQGSVQDNAPGSDPGMFAISRSCLLLGDGAALSYEALSSAGLQCRMAPELLKWQTAYGVALAAMHGEHVDSVQLAPVYLRPSQAERVHMESDT